MSVAQSSAVVASAINFVWTQYYPCIVITNTNASSVTTNAEVFVRTDGTQAVAGAANNQAIPPNSTQVVMNQMPLPNADSSNVLGLLNDPLHSTQVSVIGGSAGPMEVTVSPQ